MDLKSTIIDQIHIFDHTKFIENEESINQRGILIATHKSKDLICYLVKKEEDFNEHNKIMFIDKCEKSYELIHPSILNLSGFSIQKPYLYYKYVENHPKKDTYKPEEILEIIIGIASGLSYLLSNGFFYSNFSINSIIFDENSKPKLFDYIEFEDSKKMNEDELIIKYVEVITTIIPEKDLQFNHQIVSLLKSVNQKENLPTFEEFVQSFNSSDCEEKTKISSNIFSLLKYKDKFGFNANVEFIENDEIDLKYKSIEEICYYFYEEKPKILTVKDVFILNCLPDYYVKRLFTFLGNMGDFNMRYIQYDDLFKNKVENEEESFKIYIELKEQIKDIEDKMDSLLFFDSKREELEYQLEKRRIQAIYYLKKSNNLQAKIELAVQRIKGNMLPYNLAKAKDILDKIKDVSDEKTKKIIKKMKEKNTEMLNEISIDNVLSNLPREQNEILQKARQGNILYMLFVGFSFFTGYNGFPIIRPLSIYFYQEAAKKSSHAMNLLGYLYFKGIFFPRNFQRARKCFAKAAKDGYVKAEIIDGIFRKKSCRSYLLFFSIESFFNRYLPSFKSMFPNDSYKFPLINHYLENNKSFYLLYLGNDESDLQSEKKSELCSMYLKIGERDYYSKKIEQTFSEKILISSESNENEDNPLEIAKSYFYGLNNYPVNYSQALNYFKLAADKGDSEAQWRYALMIKNFLDCAEKSSKDIESYLQKSSDNNNPQGKLLYSLFLRDDENINMFQRHINECCDSGNLDAMYYYAMHLEKIDKTLEQSISYYKKAADSGHLDSLIRLIYLLKSKSETSLYEEYLNLSVSLLNETFLVKLIILNDKNKKYDQSNILIQTGIMINYRLFNAYYADHLLFGKGMDADIEKAQKLVKLAFEKEYSDEYLERYLYVVLDIYILKDKHREAVEFLIKYRSKINSRYKYKFISFYLKLDKIIAKKYYITVYFYDKEYQKFYDILEELMSSNKKNVLAVYSKMDNLAKLYNNVYAMIELGRLKKNGKFISRDLKTVVQYFSFAAKRKCPQGYYYLGKEYFYGRILNQDFNEAKKFFILALRDNGEPRAGYYIYKIPNIKDDVDVDDVCSLKISASFGYKRALYLYGKLLYTHKDPRISMDKPQGCKLLLQSAYQGYSKATRFCRSHNIHDRLNIDINLIKHDKTTISSESSLGKTIKKDEINSSKNDDINSSRIEDINSSRIDDINSSRIDDINDNKIDDINSSKIDNDSTSIALKTKTKSYKLIHPRKSQVSNSKK